MTREIAIQTLAGGPVAVEGGYLFKLIVEDKMVRKPRHSRKGRINRAGQMSLWLNYPVGALSVGQRGSEF